MSNTETQTVRTIRQGRGGVTHVVWIPGKTWCGRWVNDPVFQDVAVKHVGEDLCKGCNQKRGFPNGSHCKTLREDWKEN